jgi:hypothetical protein
LFIYVGYFLRWNQFFYEEFVRTSRSLAHGGKIKRLLHDPHGQSGNQLGAAHIDVLNHHARVEAETDLQAAQRACGIATHND